MQLQGQAIGSAQLSRIQRHHRPYRYFWNCWSRILREEGFFVLYRGLSPALLRQSVYGTIKFGLYPNLKSREGRSRATMRSGLLTIGFGKCNITLRIGQSSLGVLCV